MTEPCKPIDIVCFDCDSTLSRIEGIDELARRAGVESDVAPLTVAAMAGEIGLDAVYAKRMELVRPGRAAIEWLGNLYVEEMVRGGPETMEHLLAAGRDVHVISGGIRQAILPLAGRLGIPPGNVHAVDVYFDEAGNYAGFDGASPLARPGGKAEICRKLSGTGKSLALVGDGATDLEARAAGAFIVGFGGVVVRDNVKAASDIFVEGPALNAVLGPLLS